MNQITLSLEETIDLIGQIPCNLAHPQSIGSRRNSADLHSPRRQVYKEEDHTPLQSMRRPHFHREKIAGHDLFPVSRQELLPGRLPTAFRSLFDTVPFQNIGNRVVGQRVTEISQCSLNPTMSPNLSSPGPCALPISKFLVLFAVGRAFGLSCHRIFERSVSGARPSAFLESQ